MNAALEPIPTNLEAARAARRSALTALRQALETASAAQATADAENAATARARQHAEAAQIDDAPRAEGVLRDHEARARRADALLRAAGEQVERATRDLEGATHALRERVIAAQIDECARDLERITQLESEALILRKKWVAFDIGSGNRLPRSAHRVLAAGISAPPHWYHEIILGRTFGMEVEAWKEKLIALIERD